MFEGWSLKSCDTVGVATTTQWIEGMELCALRALLDKEDPVHEWGGLKKVLTPEGHCLCLSERHAADYVVCNPISPRNDRRRQRLRRAFFTCILLFRQPSKRDNGLCTHRDVMRGPEAMLCR